MTRHSKNHDDAKPEHENGGAAQPDATAEAKPQPEEGCAAPQDPKSGAGAAYDLPAKVEELKKALAEAEDARLRLLAEMDNQRKRLGKDMEALRLSVMADTLLPFLQVFDHFSMAVSAASSSNNLKSLIDGMAMIQAEFDKAFGELGVAKVDAAGKDFDPMLHEAVSEEPSDEVPAGRVLRQWSCGYKVGERLLKPAMVVVCSGPEVAKT